MIPFRWVQALLGQQRGKGTHRVSSGRSKSRRYCVLGAVSLVLTHYFIVIDSLDSHIHTRELSRDVRPQSRSVVSVDVDSSQIEFCAVRAKLVPNNAVAKAGAIKQTNTSALSLTDTEYIHLFSTSSPLDIVVSHCDGDISWIRQFRCNQNLRVYVYLKCGASEAASAFSTKSCVRLVNLTSHESAGPEGTLRHFIHSNYYSLNLTYFCKDREQIGARIAKVPSGPIKRLRLGLAALDGTGGFVHTAQDAIRHDPFKYLSFDLYTLLFGLGDSPNVVRPSAYQRCGLSLPFQPCEEHWWFRLMDTRDNTDWLSSALSWRTSVQHFKRDAHFYSFFQAIRSEIPGLNDNVRGGFSRDGLGFPSATKKDTDSFCSLYSTLTCTPCSNPWIPARTQFLVSSRRMQSLPRHLYTANSSIFTEYTWGLVFNCFVPYNLHREGEISFLRCTDP